MFSVLVWWVSDLGMGWFVAGGFASSGFGIGAGMTFLRLLGLLCGLVLVYVMRFPVFGGVWFCYFLWVGVTYVLYLRIGFLVICFCLGVYWWFGFSSL